MGSYYHKTIMSTSSKRKVSKFKELIKYGPFFICAVRHRCLYRRSVVIFDQNKHNLEIPPLFCIKSFDSSTYICKTCGKKCQKMEIPSQSVSNKLEVFDLPTEFQSIRKLERVLIAKRVLFKRITGLSRGQVEKITGTICNIPVDDIDIYNLLPRTADSTGLVIVELKGNLEYGGHVLFEAVRPAFLCNILYYLRENISFV